MDEGIEPSFFNLLLYFLFPANFSESHTWSIFLFLVKKQPKKKNDKNEKAYAL